MTLLCEDCKVYFFAVDVGFGLEGVDYEDNRHMEHEWSNPNWEDTDGR